MKGVLIAAALIGFSGTAYAQDAMAPAAGTELPVCSKDVRDRCQQGPVAEARAAAEYKGGGRDNSAMMTETQAMGRKGKSAKKPG